jgi:Na+/H+ antiporter NhaD/arsenite permease-like protein
MSSRRTVGLLAGAMLVASGASAEAATDLPGESMGWLWAAPFIAVLLSIATGPLFYPRVWHHHYGKIVGLWALLTIVALGIAFGWEASLAAFVHSMLAEYMSFILLLFALYTVAGGILVTGNMRGTPGENAVMIGLGTLMASFVGTTGAAMILIRPVIRANLRRSVNAHVVVFFIFLVANIGGALTPIGDPPLFVGFLRGVDFFWTMEHLWAQTAIAASLVLALFILIDSLLYRRESRSDEAFPGGPRIQIRGAINFVLIGLIVATVVASALWRAEVGVEILNTRVEVQNLARDGALVLIALLSLWLTPNEHREENGFTWEPMREVAILFAAIFVAIIPVLAMLHAERDGVFAPLLAVITESSGEPNQVAYFWLTGSLSAFLDNAPTYLVFFELAGGNPQALMGPFAGTLAGISMGAVYMGALTYLGNAPNLMIYAIATERGIAMPSFLAYFLWASVVLIPIFLLLTLLPVAPVLSPT